MFRRVVQVLILVFLIGLISTVTLAQPPQATPVGTLDGHTEFVYAIAWSPDGGLIYTGGFDGTIRTWDAATRKEVARYEVGPTLVLTVSPSPDGSMLLSGDRDKALKLWKRPDLSPGSRLADLAGEVRALAMNPDGSRAVFASGKGVHLWDFRGGADRTIDGHGGEVASVAWRNDGIQVASGDKSRTIRLWNPADGSPQGMIETPAEAVLGLAFTPDNTMLVSAGSDGLARLWKLPVVEPKNVDAQGPINLFAATRDGSRIATAGDKRVRIWNAADGALLKEISSDAGVTAVTLHDDGARVAIALDNHSVRICNVADGAELRKIENLAANPVAACFDPHASRLAIAGDDQQIRIVSLDDGKEQKAFGGHAGRINALAWLPKESERLVSASADKSVKLWNVEKGEMIREFAGHGDAVLSLATSDDGGILATGAADKIARVFRVGDGQILSTLPGHGGAVTAVRLAADTNRLATGSADHLIRFWDLSEPATPREWQVSSAHGSAIVGLSVSRDGVVTSGGGDARLRTWMPAAVRVFAGHQRPISGLAISADGKQIATASADKTARLFELESGKELRSLPHAEAVRAVSFAANPPRVATITADKFLRTWNPGDGKPLTNIPLNANPLALMVTPDGKKALVGTSEPAGVKLVDLAQADAAKAISQVLATGGGPITAVGFAGSDGKDVLVGSEDRSIRVVPLGPTAPIRAFAGHSAQIYDVSWAPDGKHAATGGADKTMRIWDIEKGSQERSIDKAHDNVVYAVTYHPKEPMIATAGDDKLIKFWNPADGKEIRRATGHAQAVYALAFRPDGSMLASGSVDKTVRLWNPADGKELKTLSGHPDDVYSVAWSPDGKRLASIGYGGNLIVWDVDAGKPVSQQMVGNHTPCYGLTWSPDGKTLGVAASDAKAYLFTVPSP